MSLLTFAHHFCDLNVLKISEFCRRFSASEPGPESKSTELIDPNRSALDVDEVVRLLSPENSTQDSLFASAYAVTGNPVEVHSRLRYCPACLDKGFHFAFQQLSWLTQCPIHGESLESRCGCGSRPSYKINCVNRPPRKLCACGEVWLGEIKTLSPQETSRHHTFLKQLYLLKRNLRTGLHCVRIDDTPGPDSDELLATFKLLRHVIHALTVYDGDVEVARPVLSCSLGFLGSNPGQALDDLFEQHLVNLAERRFRAHMGIREACKIIGFFELQLLGRKAGGEGSSPFRINAEKESPDEALLAFAKAAMAVRLLDAMREGTLPLDDSGSPSFSKFADEFGRPACMLWIPDGPTGRETAFWLEDTHYDCPAPFAWMDEFARFYFKHITMGRFTPGAVETKLTVAEDVRARRLLFSTPCGSVVNSTQRDLFGDLGD